MGCSFYFSLNTSKADWSILVCTVLSRKRAGCTPRRLISPSIYNLFFFLMYPVVSGYETFHRPFLPQEITFRSHQRAERARGWQSNQQQRAEENTLVKRTRWCRETHKGGTERADSGASAALRTPRTYLLSV